MLFTSSWPVLFWCLTAYLVGSLATAILVSRALGLPDPRQAGSHNPGATNVLRLGGKKAAALTLLGDLLKGLLPVLAARLAALPTWAVALVALATFLGHLYPLYFGFRGGKGVATTLGILLAVSPPLGLATLATWLLVFAVSRVSSLSALIATVAAPIYAWFLLTPPSLRGLVVVLALWVLWRHRSNIQRLLHGQEGGFRRP
ncbi:glycerol-3-phosphate 1-O-acyltransferase PlsY [Acidithiobacillus sp. AMEEHan]|uniref:glycerol-3-phosphate 1-O-acyltransferase PlsY n=1 Tax=Acidithiobacillus sp. AMEEHan TaxID=2994951 RepID=UPI0027E557E5|nr:glycerol-3-phosphate 1-O-acyltransferase PlsY [Acidithiobacillus sp. AMEEHan]